MEFDPVLGVWVGNDQILKSFSSHQPALIINRGRHDKPKTVGKMVWDAKEHKWRGNEEDLRSFEGLKRPPLISKLSSDQTPKEINGMIFDPGQMRWIGNDKELIDFGTISDASPDDGFVVGTEFLLPSATIQLFNECGKRHATTTSGWWQDEKARNHLHVIRAMAITRIVRDVKRTTSFSYYEEPADMDIAPDKEVPALALQSGVVEEADFDDAEWADVGPFVGSARLKLPDVETSGDIDIDLDQEPSKDKPASRGGSKLRLDVVEEDWDVDFADLDKIPQRLGTTRNAKSPTNTITNATHISGLNSNSGFISGAVAGAVAYASSINLYPAGAVVQLGKDKNGASGQEKKPFALLKADAPQRRSFQVLPVDGAKNPKQHTEDIKYFEITELLQLGYEGSDEDDELGLEIPAELPLQLKLNRAPLSVSEEDVRVDLDGEYEDSGSNSNSEPYEPEEELEEVEEEWFDVDVPPTLGEPITKRPAVQEKIQPPPPEKEEWDDFPQIPTEKLALKMSQQKQQMQHQQQQKEKKGREEDWDGLEIPDNFQLRLKRK